MESLGLSDNRRGEVSAGAGGCRQPQAHQYQGYAGQSDWGQLLAREEGSHSKGNEGIAELNVR